MSIVEISTDAMQHVGLSSVSLDYRHIQLQVIDYMEKMVDGWPTCRRLVMLRCSIRVPWRG